MALDSRIALGIQPVQIENPLNQLAKMAQLQSLQREGEMFELKKQQLTKEGALKDRQNRLMEALFPVDQDVRAYNALYEGAQNGSIGPTVENAKRMDAMPAPTPGQPRMSLATLNQLAATGYDTKPLFDLYKYQKDGVKRETNTYYEDPTTGQLRYFADPAKGLDFDPSTRTVSPLKGYAGANAAIKGAETDAVERARANYDLLPLGYTDQSGRPIGGSKGQYLAGNGLPQIGGEQPVPTAPAAPQMDFVGSDLLMQIPPKDRQKILQDAQRSGDSQFSVNYRLPSGQVIKGEVDLSRDSSGNTPQFLQQKVDYIRSKASPEERHQFEQQTVQGLLGIADPKKRAEAIADFYQQMNEPAGTPVRPRGTKGNAPAAGGMPVLQSEAEKKAQLGKIETSQAAQGDVNKNWTTNSYQPAIQAGRDAQGVLGSITALRNINMQTGWGTEAMANAANVLTGLGVASDSAKQLATNAQAFQANAMERLWTTLNAAKGPQTEGDADRAKATWAQLRNTPQANQYILDLAEARARRDAKRAEYYADALPLAIQEGDLTKVDREWNKIQTSIWSDPLLQKYAKKGGK